MAASAQFSSDSLGLSWIPMASVGFCAWIKTCLQLYQISIEDKFCLNSKDHVNTNIDLTNIDVVIWQYHSHIAVELVGLQNLIVLYAAIFVSNQQFMYILLFI